MNRRTWLADFALLQGIFILAWGCGREQPAQKSPLAGHRFAAVSRPVSRAAVSARHSLLVGSGMTELAGVDASNNFYLAIRKSELGRRFFLAAYLKQFFPDGVLGGAASSLGTRVVSLRLQNDKLFVFDISEGNKLSDTFNPELVLEAYPIVPAPETFALDAEAENFILIDPAAGLNRFSLIGEEGFGSFARFTVDLSFLQRFRELPDGVAFDQVFTGTANRPIHGFSGGEPNAFRGSGTIGIALRDYAEGEGFVPTTLPPGSPEFFFRSSAARLSMPPRATPSKWNIHPGMKPIRWLIAPGAAQIQSDPRLAQYDVVRAIKDGVERWNDVFGFKALEAVVADPDDTFGDDESNYVLFNQQDLGFAFADWRENPDSGEIRGATVYFDVGWVRFADRSINADPGAFVALTEPAPRPEITSFSWNELGQHRRCALWTPPHLEGGLAGDLFASTDVALAPLSKVAKVERYLTHVILHEIGHTLGLRHNFKGSLLPPSSSVMDYLPTADRILVDNPGPYDAAAVRFLHGLSASTPPQPFCTDGQYFFDPDCSTFDHGANPLLGFWGPQYSDQAASFLAGQSGIVSSLPTNNVLKYVRSQFHPLSQQAWRIAFPPGLAVPIDKARIESNPIYGLRADTLSNALLSRLYLDPLLARGGAVPRNDPAPTDPVIGPLARGELFGILLNQDGIRSFASRRNCVDILKKMQTADAYSALVRARDAIAADVGTLPPSSEQALLTRDLLGRIDAAITPYFR